MTIGKKLYIGFGSILFILVGLFVVNIIAGLREQAIRPFRMLRPRCKTSAPSKPSATRSCSIATTSTTSC